MLLAERMSYCVERADNIATDVHFWTVEHSPGYNFSGLGKLFDEALDPLLCILESNKQHNDIENNSAA